MLVLLTLVNVQTAFAQTSDLQLKVVDYNGNPVGNVEVILTNSTLRRAFRSTSAGIATFRGLSPGEYNVQVTIDNVPVANETVRVPHEGERIVRLAVAELKARVLDAEGAGVKGVTVQIRSSTGKSPAPPLRPRTERSPSATSRSQRSETSEPIPSPSR